MDFNANKKICARGTDTAKVVQVIETKAMCGAGTENDPVKEVVQYWTLDGQLLFEHFN